MLSMPDSVWSSVRIEQNLQLEEVKIRKTILLYGKVWIHTAVKDRQVRIRIRKEEQKKVARKKIAAKKRKSSGRKINHIII